MYEPDCKPEPTPKTVINACLEDFCARHNLAPPSTENERVIEIMAVKSKPKRKRWIFW